MNKLERHLTETGTIHPLARACVRESIAAYNDKLTLQASIHADIEANPTEEARRLALLQRMDGWSLQSEFRGRMQSRCGTIGHEYTIGAEVLPVAYASAQAKEQSASVETPDMGTEVDLRPLAGQLSQRTVKATLGDCR